MREYVYPFTARGSDPTKSIKTGLDSLVKGILSVVWYLDICFDIWNPTQISTKFDTSDPHEGHRNQSTTKVQVVSEFQCPI